jgi:hypothetical protein
VKKSLVGAAVWIVTAWFWTYMLLGLFIPIGAYHTAQEERVHQAYVNGPNKPTIEEVENAIQGTFRHTDRIKMLIAVPFAFVEYGLYIAFKSRRNNPDATSTLAATRGQ